MKTDTDGSNRGYAFITFDTTDGKIIDFTNF